MGCDGGSIPTRCELVKTKKKEERADPAEVTRVRWTLCALSKEPLVQPVVACPQGCLFNKEALITHLIQKTLPSAFSYIRSLKDVLELKLAENPAWGKVEDAVRFVCPVTGIEANGRHGGFSALRGCGCVFSDRALREVPTEECLACRRPFVPAADVLPLNPPLEVAQHLLSEWKARMKSQRKNKKSKRRPADATVQAATAAKDEGKKGAPGDGTSGKRKHEGPSGDNKKETKQDLPTQANSRTEPVVKKARTAPAKEEGPAIVTKMSKDVYSSIFLSNAQQRQKSVTFTHYG